MSAGNNHSSDETHDAPPSPSGAEHVNVHEENHLPSDNSSPSRKPDAEDEEKTVTYGVGEGATVSHINR